MPKFLTIDDFDLNNKTVLVRVDFNSPLDPKTKQIINDKRIRAHASATIEDLVKIARGNEPIEVSHKAWDRIEKCRKVVEDLIERKEKLYGVTTGIGELSEVFLTPEQVGQFQKYLIFQPFIL